MNRMQKLGELLREARERKKISIKEASGNTKIREGMILALESGDYGLFSSDTHLKGFIKAYSRYLGINEDKALAMYRRERSLIVENEDSLNQKTQSDFSIAGKLSRIFNWRNVTFTIGLLLIAIIIYFFYAQIQAFYRPPRLEILSPTNNEVIESDVFVIEGFTDSIAVKVFVDGNEANFIDTNGRFKVNAKFNQPGAKKFTITAENDFNKKTEYSLDLTYRPKETIVQKNKIKFYNKSEKEYQVRYTTDNKLVYDYIVIQPQDTYEIDFDSKVSVKDFDPGKLDVYLNNGTSPLNSIDAKEFTVEVENSLPIIKTN